MPRARRSVEDRLLCKQEAGGSNPSESIQGLGSMRTSAWFLLISGPWNTARNRRDKVIKNKQGKTKQRKTKKSKQTKITITTMHNKTTAKHSNKGPQQHNSKEPQQGTTKKSQHENTKVSNWYWIAKSNAQPLR